MKRRVGLFIFIFLLASCQKTNFDESFQAHKSAKKSNLAAAISAVPYVFSVSGKSLKINNVNFKIIGLRCSNALISNAQTTDLINNLSIFKSYGINTVSVYLN